MDEPKKPADLRMRAAQQRLRGAPPKRGGSSIPVLVLVAMGLFGGGFLLGIRVGRSERTEAVATPGATPHVARKRSTGTPTCESRIAEFRKALGPLRDEWDDADRLAGQTPRMALAPQVQTLQAIRRRAEGLPENDCVKESRIALFAWWDESIGGYIAFLGKEEFIARSKMEDAEKAKKIFEFVLYDIAINDATPGGR